MSLRIAQRLKAPDPGWENVADVIVVGSGIAGLSSAMHARRAGHRVLLVTKATVDEGSTRWAQGGIAAALSDDDSPADHLQDTLVAGAGLCDPAAAQVLVYEGPSAVRRLVRWGAAFDRNAAGDLELTREGGHLRDRIAHAGGDATGVEISRALVAAVAEDPKIELVEHALVLDLLVDKQGAAQGLTLHVMGEGQRDGVGAALAPAIVLATGGVGQVFAASTNPAVATGDGIGLGLRAGAAVADLEFTQFHPTVLWLEGEQRGQQPLVSEAVRGEGALLLNDAGERFLVGVHPLAELAPRDVVAKAISHQMRATGAEHVWLDATMFGADKWERRFPTILESCRRHGVDPVTQPIPVVPAQHYESGGLVTDLHGRTNIEGLFAVGEVACTGVHGANRLASNSLLEGLVFADRIGSMLAAGLPERRDAEPASGTSSIANPEDRARVQEAMTDGVGVLRTTASMNAAAKILEEVIDTGEAVPRTESWETTNIAHTAAVLTTFANLRTETRGSHWRDDCPDRDDANWRVRLVATRNPDGALDIVRKEVGD